MWTKQQQNHPLWTDQLVIYYQKPVHFNQTSITPSFRLLAYIVPHHEPNRPVSCKPPFGKSSFANQPTLVDQPTKKNTPYDSTNNDRENENGMKNSNKTENKKK